MAINFLNSVDFNKNELLNPTIENQPNDASAGTGIEGQLYFNTTDDILKVWAGGAWKEVGGGVTSLITTNGTYINLTPISATTGDVTVTADLSAADGVAAVGERYLTKQNTWAEVAAIPGTYEWTASDDTNSEIIASGDTVTFLGTGTTTVSYATATNTFTINSADQFTGTLTGVTQGAGITVTASATSPTVAIDYLGTDNYVLSGGVATTADAADIIGFSDATDNNVKQTTLGDIPVAALALVKTYIDDSVAGGLVYQGGYDAATNTPDLTTSPNSIEKGWTYTVTADGTFFSEQLRVGDVLIAEIDNPTSLADWTTVQNNIDLASLTQVGIGNVNAGTGISVAYVSGTATVTNTDTNSANTATGQITAGDTSSTVTHNFGTTNVIVQTYLDNVTDNYPTVFCDITRSSSTVTATIATAQTDNIIILVQKIG